MWSRSTDHRRRAPLKIFINETSLQIYFRKNEYLYEYSCVMARRCFIAGVRNPWRNEGLLVQFVKNMQIFLGTIYIDSRWNEENEDRYFNPSHLRRDWSLLPSVGNACDKIIKLLNLTKQWWKRNPRISVWIYYRCVI